MVQTQTHCYHLLGLSESATLTEVKRAYRRLARTMHPDAGGDHARFAEITAAYNVLTGRSAPAKAAPRPRSDEDFDRDAAFADFRRRAAHFRTRAASPEPSAQPQASTAPTTPDSDLRAEAPSQDESAFVEELQTAQVTPEVPRKPSLWARLRSRLRRTRVRSTDGTDVRTPLSVDLEMLLRGGERLVSVERLVTCPSCAGQGSELCVCGGQGRVLTREKVKVVVPAGARPGAQLRLRRKGNDGVAGGATGDLYLDLQPIEIDGYLREGADLRGTLAVPTTLARQGGALAIPTPWGSVRLDVPPGTRDGMRFRLPGQGLPRWQGAGRGELYLLVAVR
jgi:molecular chaperone DnaJ